MDTQTFNNDVDGPVPLESILCTDQLNRRPSRPPDYESENRALVSLAQALADSPRTILQTLADTILDMLRADSAGISLLTVDEKRFYWPAIAGVWKEHIGGGTPRDFGPCGDVLDRNRPLLFSHIERRYTYFQPVKPWVEECLLVPFSIEGKSVGTIWAVAHNDRREFDREDLRQLVSLGRFASSAYQAVASSAAFEQVAHDLRIEEEKLREADRRKDEFLATLAHELRNPLAPIRNAVQILRLSTGDDNLVQSASEMMERQVNQMVRLVDDLLEMSRISHGKIELRNERIELASVVHHAVEAVESLLESKEHELTLTMPDPPIYLCADATRLAQVVGNLLNNACKFTEPRGHIWLTVDRESEQAVIRVRDNGMGIASGELSHIFDMFGQVDATIGRSQGGLGIGLTLVKHLVELHGGTLEVHSPGIGHGSEFVVRLPNLVGALAPSLVPTVSEPTTTVPRRILVVDDNKDSAKTLAMLLQLTGHETFTAHDGYEAIETALTACPEIILLDIGLPKLNGFDAARRMRQHPKLKDVKLVAMTGFGQEADRQRSRDAGFNHHLVKPVDFGTLKKLLSEA